MNNIRLGLLLVTIFLLASCGSTGSSADATALTGEWQGRYTCNQGLTGLTLTLAGTTGGAVDAVFSFYPVDENPGVASGSFSMRGTYNSSTRRLTLNADEDDWIERPSNYLTVDLDGTVSANLATYSGDVSGSAGCTTFLVTKQ